MRDEVTHDLGASFVAIAFTQPQGMGQGTKAFVATASPQARQAIVDPKCGVVFDGEAFFAKDQHGPTLVTALGLATSALYGSDCRLAGLFDEVAHDARSTARAVPAVARG
jgi:hypothetical protein